MGFSRQEYWSGLPFPSPEDIPHLGIESGSPALKADGLPSEPPGKFDESGRAVLKLNIHKTKIMASDSITSWQIDGETMNDRFYFISHLFLLGGGQPFHNIAVGFVIH